MATNVFSTGTFDVQFSITNPSVNLADTQDNLQPFSFFEYLKNTKQLNTPDQFTQQYSNYLHAWYGAKNVEQTVQQDEIRQRYVDLLKDIAYNYTTSEERRFLANLDYDDASDLSIAIPFYAQKLKEICLFYATKRDAFKHRIQEIKIKGTTLSIERAIYNSIIDYLSTADNIAAAAVVAAVDDMQINIVEYVDAYSNYFDLDPNASASDLQITNALRAKYLTSNTNAISASLFLNLRDTIANEVLNTPFYLKEIGKGLLVNPQKLIQQALNQAICSEQTLAQLLNTTADALSGNYALKRKLIEKYIGTDFYYLSTNSLNQYVSGALFKAANASGNLINKRFATTATVAEDQLISLQKLGLFFKPDKMGVLQFATPKKHFIVDAANLQSNKIYIFPDPDIYGNVDNFAYSNLEHPLLYVLDNTSYIKDIDQGPAQGKIKSNEYLQNFYAYFSEPVYINADNINVSSFDANMLRIFNQGTFDCYAQDVYGNAYGLIKNIQRYNRVQTDAAVTSNKCITMDGYVFYDDLSGYDFDYAATGINFDGSIQTGLTSLTVNNFPPGGGSFTTGYSIASAGMFYLSGALYTLYFREYSPFIECNTTDTYTCSIRDGGYFAASDTELLPDVSSDSIALNENSRVYYTMLCDAGISATNSLVPGLTSAALTATIVSPALTSPLYETFDGRLFPNECIIAPDYNYAGTTIAYFDDVNDGCTSALQISQPRGAETLNDAEALQGTVLVKNIATNQVMPLSSALSATFAKYNDLVRTQLYGNDIKHINVYYDSLAIRTSDYLVFDKIRVSDAGEFQKPGTINNYIAKDANDYANISNTFFIEDAADVWAFKTTLLPVASASNAKTIYPQIYKYSINSNKLERKYPGLFTTNNELSSLFSNALTGINIMQVSDANIAYASYNNKFVATWTAVDLNGLSYLFSAWFDYKNDEIIFDADQIAVYKTSTTVNTLNFYNALSTFSDAATASAGNATFANNNNILYFN